MRGKSILLSATSIMVVLAFCGSVWAFSGSGWGTEADPYVITTVQQLQEMQDKLDACYALGNDIDASDTVNWNGGAGFVPVGTWTGDSKDAFSGTLDGMGHSIQSLHISRIDSGYQGLLGYSSGATIQNVHLRDAEITADLKSGTLGGKVSGGSIITKCSATGTVTLKAGTADSKSGGLIGSVTGGCQVEECSSGVNVNASNRKQVGGLIGYHEGRTRYTLLTNSYSYGTVTGGGSKQGNLVGDADGSYVDRCYSCGYGKALIGFNWENPVITNSYWDKDKGASSSRYGGTPKTTAQMQTKGTFTNVGWDFNTPVWKMCDRPDYPRLWWEECPPPLIIYVDADATGANNGSSWDHAYNDLEDALCAARYGDEIRVAQGAYSPEGPLPDIYQASNPNPVDGSYNISINADLSWTAGYDAISHDVYFGTRNPPPFIQNQTGTTFDPGKMAYSTVYYWRIDEVDDSIITTGDIWNFTTVMSPPPPQFGSSNEDESIEPAANRSATFQLKNGVVIKGGYAGFGQPDPNERDIDKYKTILSGDLNGDDVEVNDPCDLLTEPSRAENSYHVVTGSDCNESAVLDGFTITAGNANGEYYPLNQGSGGGIQIRFGEMREVGPVLKNCTFIENSARSGGGMYNDHCSTTLTNCTFSENFADWGGGIGNAGFPVPKLVDCTFIANRAGYKGGAIANAESRPTLESCKLIANHAELGGAIYNGEAGAILTNCTLIGNSAERGGAVYNNDGIVRMTNCIVSENSCTEKGGVVYLGSDDGAILTNCILTANSAEKGGVLYVGYDSYAKLKNCTVTGNWATDNGGALYFDGPDDAIITNCILWSDTPQEIYPDLLGNEIVITYNDVQGGWPGQGNINVEPCFVDSGYWDTNGVWIDGNYHLLQTSTCTNAGDNYSLPADTQDLDGDGNTVEPIPFDIEGSPRIVYDVVDMGAYEFDNIPPIADAGPDQIVECACNTEVGTKVILDGTNSNDSDHGVLTYTWTGPFVGSPVQEATPTITLEGGCPGEYVIRLVVNDGIDESEPNGVVITVVDTTPPEFEFSVVPTMLWPPDHKMVEITPSWTVSDDCVSTPDVSLVSIVANEGDDTIGDGHTSNDIQIGEDGSIYLRSERTGTGNDRIYTITYQAVDDCGNVAIRSVIVSIPHEFKVLARIAARWLWAHQAGNIPEDLNSDGIVNFADFAMFAQNWIK